MKTLSLSALSLSAAILVACSASNQNTDNTNVLANLDPLAEAVSAFDKQAIIGTPKIVDCTLSGGAKTECLSLTMSAQPSAFKIGPWCPRNISDGPDVSGIWLNEGKVYEADGSFIQNLSSFYKDDNWQLFDPETGAINVTDTKVSCEAAARPDVDPEYQNHCVECSMSYLPDGASQTYIIPLKPENADTINPRVDHAGVGIAFSGVRLDAAAPIEAILSAYTIAAFDDCGGHVNPNVGYHLHAVRDCLTGINVKDGHAQQIGIAMDGYPLHTQFNSDGVESKDLDMCRGHDTNGLGYHYHVNDPGANAIIPCHTGQIGCAIEDGNGVCDASAPSGRRRPPPGNRTPPPDRQ